MRKRPRGSVLVEFALASVLLAPALAAMFQLGYSCWVYNALETAVRSGARYASRAAYDGADFDARVRNMVVYGEPEPAADAAPRVPGLAREHIRVEATFHGPMPERVTVGVEQFPIPVLWGAVELRSRPASTFQYMGRLVTP